MKYYTTSKISENMHETPEGYLLCVAVPIARPGEMLYADGELPLEAGDDGVLRISREADELFRPDTMASFEGKPVTVTHPKDFISPENWAALAKGIIQNVRRGKDENKDDLVADLLITDSHTILLIKSGLREVSCGYEAHYEQTEEGFGIQKHIVGNHLALVEKGRAGSAYAINDHQGVKKMSIKDKVKAIFAKAQDDAMKVVDEDGGDDKDKAPKSKAKAQDDGEDQPSMADVLAALKALTQKVEAMSGKSEDDGEDAPPKKKKKDDDKDESKDADEETADDDDSTTESRLKALEVTCAKILAALSDDDEDSDEDEDDEETDDEDGMQKNTMKTGDTASRVEILAPGLKAKTKDAKAQALKAAFATKDGKAVILSLTGGKTPTFDAQQVETLFIATSELLKVKRAGDLSKTKGRTQDGYEDPGASAKGPLTAEQQNEINAKFYGKK